MVYGITLMSKTAEVELNLPVSYIKALSIKMGKYNEISL